MQFRDLLDLCANDVMMTIYIATDNNPRGYTITGTVGRMTRMVSKAILDYNVAYIEVDDNSLEIRLMEDD